ncbi:MAG: membrane protein insertase YidC, partial [Casimicrobiaceae bacterium]
MDTQRLLLFVIFSFSGLFLWEAWQREHAPVPPPPSAAAVAKGDARPADLPAAAPRPATPAPAAVPGGAAPAGAPAGGQTVTIKTDLYTADIETVGGVITLVALDKHRDPHDTAKPYLMLQRNAERTFVAQAGLIGDGMQNHRTTYQALPGARTLAAGADKLDLKLEATAANGDKVVQTLTFNRGSYVIDAAFDVTNATGAPYVPEAYFQLMRDTKQAVTQTS